MDGASLPTRILAAAFYANGSNADLVADWYNLGAAEVLAAVKFDEELRCMKLFFDRCMSPRLANMIQALEIGHTIRHHDDYGGFDQNTTDIEWITRLSNDDPLWVVISGDGRILKNQAERAALKEAKLKFFCLARAWPKMPIYEFAWKFIKAWPNIVEHAQHSSRMIFQISSGSDLKIDPLD